MVTFGAGNTPVAAATAAPRGAAPQPAGAHDGDAAPTRAPDESNARRCGRGPGGGPRGASRRADYSVRATSWTSKISSWSPSLMSS
jgi:hypothetical protein